MTNHTKLQTARPTEGITTYAAMELAATAKMRAIEDRIEAMWPDHSVWEIERATGRSAREVWGIHQRLDTAKREAQNGTVTSGEKV